jgi:hypothetical protein
VSPHRVVIFEPQPAKGQDYLELFTVAGYTAQLAQPTDDVAAIGKSFAPTVVVFDMWYWEGDTALVFGILQEARTFERPLIVAVCNIPFQLGRAKRFGADGTLKRGGTRIWGGPEVLPGEELVKLVALCDDLISRRAAGELPPRKVKTPL